MKARKLALLGTVACLSLLTGAGCPDTSHMFVLDGRDDGSTIQAHVGDTMRIYLAMDPATGRSWQEDLTYDFYMLSLREEVPITNPNATPAGSQGVFEQSWEIRKAGSTQVHWKYYVLTDPSSPIDATFTINVEVAP